MAAMHADAPGRPRVRLFVFSLTVASETLRAELASLPSGQSACLLTPHFLFPPEREALESGCGVTCLFRTFHDLLDTADMERCDGEADRQVAARGPRREDRVTEYYATLTSLKNQRLAERVREAFDVQGGAVLCGDLGIVPAVWRDLGLADRVPPVATRTLTRRQRVRRLLARPMPWHYLEWQDQRWLLLGPPERVGQYLDRSAVTLRPVGRIAACWLNLQLVMTRRLRPDSRWAVAGLRPVNVLWRRGRLPVTRLAAAVHEHNAAVALLAAALGLECVNLQDSFLPSYYPSCYLRYRPAVREFLVWDRFSQGIFRRHGLVSRVWPAYRSWQLPFIEPSTWAPVRRVVYLASGAGDWTALKNRSDEDLVLTLLAEAARLRPDVTFRYRPHPLWLHPEHQGLDSIRRAVAWVESLALPNLHVSQGARDDGQGFARSGNLSAVGSSVDEDIAWADLVLGEHSQTLLVAAQRGKVIAGLNVSRHPPYFGDYARVGFPLAGTTDTLLTLLTRMTVPAAAAAFLAAYNEAIRRHNRENCGVGETA